MGSSLLEAYWDTKVLRFGGVERRGSEDTLDGFIQGTFGKLGVIWV